MVVAVGPVEVFAPAMIISVDELVHESGPRVRGSREVVVAEDDAVGRAEAAADGLGAVLDPDERAGDGAAGLFVCSGRGLGRGGVSECLFEVEGLIERTTQENQSAPRRASPS